MREGRLNLIKPYPSVPLGARIRRYNYMMLEDDKKE